MQKLGDFKLPHFFNYPPYFTLQPVRDTREKQVQLWKELIIDYCRTQKIFVIALDEEFPLFTNQVIERSLSHEAREAFLSALVQQGRAEWIDKGHKKCLILWLQIQDWADCVLRFVKDNGFEDSVLTVEEIRTGIESQGTELHGMDRTVLMRALKVLEHKGKVTIFKGTSTDDEEKPLLGKDVALNLEKSNIVEKPKLHPEAKEKYPGVMPKAADPVSKKYTIPSIVEHANNIETNPANQSSVSSQATTSNPSKPVSRFKMQRAGR